jgi:hypothetical protein
MPVKTTLEAVSRQAQESSRHPRKPEFAINSPQRQRFTRTTVTPGLLYASTPSLCATLCSMLVSCLPLTYKRMRQSPSCGEHTSHISHNISQRSSHSPYPDIDTFLNHHNRDLEASPPLPSCLQPPSTSTTGVNHNTVCEHPLMDVRPRGRNQDKTRVLVLPFAPTIERLNAIH